MTDLGVVRFVRIIIWMYTDRNTVREAVDGVATTGARHNSRFLILLVRRLFCKQAPSNAQGPYVNKQGARILLSEPSRQGRAVQRCVFKTAANRDAPVREAVISVPTRSRSCTR